MRATFCLMLMVSILGCGPGKSNEESESDDVKVNLNTEQSNESDQQAKEANQASSEPKNKVALPADWPKDIPISDEMVCFNVTRVKDSLMVTFHTKMEVKEIVDWFQGKLAENGWKESGTPSINSTRAILAHDKDNRNCGVTVTGFVMNEAMQKDETKRGITIQTKAVQ